MRERHESHGSGIVYRLPTQAPSATVRRAMAGAHQAPGRLGASTTEGGDPHGRARARRKLVVDELARAGPSAQPAPGGVQRLGGHRLVGSRRNGARRRDVLARRRGHYLYELRLLLEPRALRASLEATDDAQERDPGGACASKRDGRRARSIPSRSPTRTSPSAALLARCPSAWMRRMVGLLAEHAQRYQLPRRSSIGAAAIRTRARWPPRRGRARPVARAVDLLGTWTARCAPCARRSRPRASRRGRRAQASKA